DLQQDSGTARRPVGQPAPPAQLSTTDTLLETIADGVAHVGSKSEAAAQATDEPNLRLQETSDKLQLAVDRAAETNVLTRGGSNRLLTNNERLATPNQLLTTANQLMTAANDLLIR
ncbi:unnamed protein product, partial [Prorocentrum cordatum]